MSFETWRKKVFEEINADTIIAPDFAEEDFAALDFEAMYLTGYGPQKAAQIAKSVRFFLKKI